MIKLNKKLISIGVVIIGVALYLCPKPFKNTYENVQVYENGNKVKQIDIKLDGKVSKDFFVWQRLKFSEVLQGKITIENKDYYLYPINPYMFPDENGNYTDNGIYSAILSSNKNDINNEEYMFYISHDKSSIYINSMNFEERDTSTNIPIYSEEFIYPFKTDEDYNDAKSMMYK